MYASFMIDVTVFVHHVYQVADGFADGIGREDPRTQTIKVSLHLRGARSMTCFTVLHEFV